MPAPRVRGKILEEAFVRMYRDEGAKPGFEYPMAAWDVKTRAMEDARRARRPINPTGGGGGFSAHRFNFLISDNM